MDYSDEKKYIKYLQQLSENALLKPEVRYVIFGAMCKGRLYFSPGGLICASSRLNKVLWEN